MSGLESLLLVLKVVGGFLLGVFPLDMRYFCVEWLNEL